MSPQHPQQPCHEVCAPGYGGAACAICSAGTWSPGGNATAPEGSAARRPECTPCGTGAGCLRVFDKWQRAWLMMHPHSPASAKNSVCRQLSVSIKYLSGSICNLSSHALSAPAHPSASLRVHPQTISIQG